MGTPIKSYSIQGLSGLMAELGQPSFRAGQLVEWLYAKHAASYDEMTNLPASLRAELAQSHPLTTPAIVDRRISKDGTRKYLVAFHDGQCVETVAIPSHDGQRLTVCFSTQIGCPMACSFCATGREGLVRDLLPGEIVDQILVAQDDMGMRVSNAVGMGQGEPFLNYDNALAALRILNSPKGLAIGARHMTVSTCGLTALIDRFASEPEQFTLAVSLHAARQEVRDAIMPKLASQPLPVLKRTLQSYVGRTNRRVTLEHLLARGVNDTQADLEALLAFCDGLHCHVNLIPLNAVAGSSLRPSSKQTLATWKQTLNRREIETTIRESRGSDIQGACGQLKNTRLS